MVIATPTTIKVVVLKYVEACEILTDVRQRADGAAAALGGGGAADVRAADARALAATAEPPIDAAGAVAAAVGQAAYARAARAATTATGA